MRSRRSREVSSRLRSSSSEFGLCLFFFLSIVLQKMANVGKLATNVEEHREHSIDIFPLDNLRSPPRPHLGILRLRRLGPQDGRSSRDFGYAPEVTKPARTSIR